MKSKDKNKQKKHESTIGKIIYGFLLFMPLLAIGVTCAYAIFNKNAYQSYYGETINNETINEITSLNIGDEVYFQNTNNIDSTTETGGVQNNFITYDNIEIIDSGNMSANMQSFILSSVKIGFYKVAENSYYSIFFYNSSNQSNSYSSTTTFTIKFVITGFRFSTLTPFQLYNQTPFTTRTYNEVSFVSEVFYYSIDKVQQSPLFNWAEDSAIYTGMAATCNALNITTRFIPLLMTYWLIISIIYFLYDIILIILHVFHRKIHELEESI